MKRAFVLFAFVFGSLLTLAGCNSTGPPAELAGLWSAGPAACAAGVGVEFDANAIAAVYDKQRETLFEQPHYEIVGHGDMFRIRIVYALPQRPGGARSVGAHGVLVLIRGADGALTLFSHNLVDPRTGSVRMRIVDDPAMGALTLTPCGGPHHGAGLRGRSAA